MSIPKLLSFAALPLALVIFAITATGCNDNKPTGQATTHKESTATPPADIQEQGLTLPVLDALFFEDSFRSELKAKLQITDQQVQQLKTAASASVADLGEDDANYTGSARLAAKNADEQIKKILGQQKADQLYKLIADRYSAGNLKGMLPTQPNAVATDTRIVVNIPAFRMDVFKDGKLIKTYGIGIGYPEFPLPTGMRRAENVIYNPTWTPPDEPWVKGKVKVGKKVAAGNKLNPLGPIKIPIGEPSLIHGGKQPGKIGNFASHGCVGLTNAEVQDFASQLLQLSGNPISQDSTSNLGKDKTKTRSVKLGTAIPVELRYETIVAENGALSIYKDVYEKGTNTIANATSVLAVYGIKYESLPADEKQALTQALDQMNKDAHGDPIAGSTTKTTDSTATAKTTTPDDEKEQRAKKGKVTRSVTGDKQVTVKIAALQSKGYPAPVNLYK